ncbi:MULTISPECIES: hypothetical protein [unclassified Moorena]|uniref:hypothetical protein n=1 Tax=unclassified Moorena TaxID=2683338 RepID=UPI0013CCBFFE|nr:MULTISPECIES: hypothetical protein [unclassified Moorena]NEO23398.1 hypothetical protein [Moorena sp. SIO4A5]NEQ61913.1 hypothetical protein [Moorena sp. SIO4A1]
MISHNCRWQCLWYTGLDATADLHPFLHTNAIDLWSRYANAFVIDLWSRYAMKLRFR